MEMQEKSDVSDVKGEDLKTSQEVLEIQTGPENLDEEPQDPEGTKHFI